MEKILKIEKIEDFRIYKDFSAPSSGNFKRYNLMYGWNGSGKTTFSDFFRCLEKGAINTSFKLKTSSGTVTESNYDTQLAKLKVFNRNYILATVPENPDSIEPIYYIGEGAEDKAERLKIVQAKFKGNKQRVKDNLALIGKHDKSLDEFKSKIAKSIKDLLTANDSAYNTYSRTHLTTTLNSISPTYTSYILNENEYQCLNKKQKEQIRDIISWEAPHKTDILKLHEHLNEIIMEKPTNIVIEKLKGNIELSQWVEQGYNYHKHRNEAVCQFCGNILDGNFYQTLESHFDDSFNQLNSKIKKAKDLISQRYTLLRAVNIPDKALLYNELQESYEKLVVSFTDMKDQYSTFCETAIDILDSKQANLNSTDALIKMDELKAIEVDFDAIDKIEAIIKNHNATTETFTKTIASARKKIEQSIVAKSVPDFKKRILEIENLKNINKVLLDENLELEKEEVTLKTQVYNHGKFAEYLSSDINNFFGRNDIKFTAMENGYKITRNGNIAENLSEGERNAIALIYFLRSLQENEFDLENSIIVIDDPISSLDSNVFYSAFGYIRKYCNNAGQLFILTHRFQFFKELLHWFKHLDKAYFNFKRSVNSAAIEPADKLLVEFQSEYHFIFKKIYQFVESPPLDTTEFFLMPNIGRRLLESFLAFKIPTEQSLDKKVMNIEYDQEIKARILRYVQTHSHTNFISETESETDASIISESPAILKQLLELIELLDKKHYDTLVAVVGEN